LEKIYLKNYKRKKILWGANDFQTIFSFSEDEVKNELNVDVDHAEAVPNHHVRKPVQKD
jgi:hypothetical protein